MHRLALGYPWVMGEKEAAKLCAFFLRVLQIGHDSRDMFV
jgi:hypothetical protein